MAPLNDLIQKCPGPILILGANGFVGWNFFQLLAKHRSDVQALARQPNWRTESDSGQHSQLFFESRGDSFARRLEELRPALILDLAVYGAYPEQTDSDRMFEVNVLRVQKNLRLVDSLLHKPMYILAGSSSEYGYRCDHPTEDQSAPNSVYALSKTTAAQLIQYFGKVQSLPCLDLRLFSVYGPYEAPTRLIPRLALQGLQNEWPELSKPDSARDFIHVDDVLAAFLMSAQGLLQNPKLAGEILNVGTGRQLNLKEVCEISRRYLQQTTTPVFGSVAGRPWDQSVWVASIGKIERLVGWRPVIPFDEGLKSTLEWWRTQGQVLMKSVTVQGGSAPALLSIVVAIHRDENSIEHLYNAIKNVCGEVGIAFELLFVNDRSPDASAERIRAISQKDPRVIGLNHAVNSGSQQAFWTGLEFARGDACVLMDGDLQDPPEVLKAFVHEWRKGHLLVLGRRVSRTMNPLLAFGHRLFYRLARRYSGVALPLDVGDFGLMDRQVVDHLLTSTTRDLWIRGLRASLGYKAAFVDYHRPERPFGRSTNSILGLFSWAYRGIFLFQGEPLRRWNRFLIFIGAPLCLIAFLALNKKNPESFAGFGLELLLLITLTMMSEILVVLYRQALGHPRSGVESWIRNGKVEKWKRTHRR